MSMKMPPQPELRVEQGAFRRLPALLAERGCTQPVLVTGGSSVRQREEWSVVTSTLQSQGVSYLDFRVQGEPSPELVNAVLADISKKAPKSDVVVAVGGGSVLDAGKAIAAGVALMRATSSGVSVTSGVTEPRASRASAAPSAPAFDITRYLEGVGDLTPDGTTLPVIAFPTTAGTGSEATMNAVLSRIGPDGFKKSLRHPGFVPQLAVLDPDLFSGCPANVTRASGLDAITQLLEAYTSTKTNPMVDTLAELGLTHAGGAFPRLLEGEDTPELRASMALAAYLSGVCLAAAGLGVVHGFASPLGALRDIPHGVVCGMLLGPVMRASLSFAPLPRYDRAAQLLGVGDSADAAIEQIESWAMPLGRLGDFGFVSGDLPGIVADTGLKNHPVQLSNDSLTAILEEVL